MPPDSEAAPLASGRLWDMWPRPLPGRYPASAVHVQDESDSRLPIEYRDSESAFTLCPEAADFHAAT